MGPGLQRGVLACVLAVAAAAAHAQAPVGNYPSRPIRMLVPFPPAGLGDIVARLVANKLADTFKQTIVVDNRGGSGGAIAIDTLVRSTPDGYTLILVTGSYAANAAIYPLAHDPIADVTPIVLVGEGANLAVTHLASGLASLKDVIAQAKASPGKLNYGSSGNGSSTHLATELFTQMAGIKMTHVPYKGTVMSLSDLYGGQLQFLIGSLPALLPQVKANRLRGLGVTTAKRATALPDVPAFAETVPGYVAVNWGALLGPKGLPAAIVQRWNIEINRMLREPDAKDSLAANGMEPIGGTPAALLEVMKRDIATWQRVVKAAGIRVAR